MTVGRTRDFGFVETEARRLARSGRYPNARRIERALLEQRVPGVEKVFKNRWTQIELDRICEQASKQDFAEPPQRSAVTTTS